MVQKYFVILNRLGVTHDCDRQTAKKSVLFEPRVTHKDAYVFHAYPTMYIRIDLGNNLYAT